MIVLSANRLDVYDTFQFRIEAAGNAPAVTGDPHAAAEILHDLGVSDPLRLVRHVRQWGWVEIIEGSPQSH
jgi:hypothetical protein